jgi:hypothetical protein
MSMPIAIHRRAGPGIRNGFLAQSVKDFLDLPILSIIIQLLVLFWDRHLHINHFEMPEALQALDNLASDVLDTFGVIGRKWGGVEGDDRGGGALAGGSGQDRGGA